MKKEPNDCRDMAELRVEIDRVDSEIMAMLAKRVAYIDRAAEIKAPIGLPARLDDRVEEVAQNARKNALAKGFDADLAEKIWREMIEWSIAREDKKLGIKVEPEE